MSTLLVRIQYHFHFWENTFFLCFFSFYFFLFLCNGVSFLGILDYFAVVVLCFVIGVFFFVFFLAFCIGVCYRLSRPLPASFLVSFVLFLFFVTFWCASDALHNRARQWGSEGWKAFGTPLGRGMAVCSLR